MTSKAELLKLADLSSKGKISLNQAEGYLAEKGLKGKERDNALRYIDSVKKEQAKRQAPNKNKSGIGFIIILVILAAVLSYLLYSGAVNFANILNFK